MFERTTAWWRHVLTRRKNRDETRHTLDQERRVWVRYPANAETTLQPTTPAPTPVRINARIRNVSQGGVNLLVDQRFDEGSVLSVELPVGADNAALVVLACVLHVQEQPDGYWSLGCNFVNELTHDDVQALGIRRERATADDPRNWVRFPAEVHVQCHAIRDDDDTYLLTASVLNVSANGIALAAKERVDAGALLGLDLSGPHGHTLSMLACVVHVTAQPDGLWTLGCNFIRELSDEDLQALL